MGGAEYPSVPADDGQADPGRESPDGRGANRRPAEARPAFDPDALVVRPEPFEALLAAWAAAGLCGGGKLQANATREGWWQQRWRDDPAFRARWREAVARAGRSAKLAGRLPGWRSPLRVDDFLRDSYLSVPNLLVRLLDEGEFDDPAPPASAPAAESPAERMRRLAAEKLGGRQA